MTDSSTHSDNDNQLDEVIVSKSQLKREAHALQKLGGTLISLNATQLKQVPLDNGLLEAIIQAQSIRKQGALKRQRQFIGKLLRKTETAPIQAAVDAILNHFRADTNRFHNIEHWRDRILADQQAINEFINDYPQAERQILRQYHRDAKSHNEHTATRSRRKIFQYLKSFIIQEDINPDQDKA